MLTKQNVIQSKKLLMIIVVIVMSLLTVCFFPILKTNKISANDRPIIADHSIVSSYENIPQYWIDQVKKMYLNVLGESHSEAYRRGLELLEDIDQRFQVINSEGGPPAAPTVQALRVDRFLYDNYRGENTGEQQWYTWHAWDDPSQAPDNNAYLIKNHIAYCEENDLHIDAIGFGWCWDMVWPGTGGQIDDYYNIHWGGVSVGGPDGDEYSSQWGINDGDFLITGNRVNMDDYLAATEQYIDLASPYGTVVFFTTGPIDDYGGENGVQREIKHEYIRQYVIDNGKVLFDYADILSHNDAGEENIEYWNNRPYPRIHSDNMKNLDGSAGGDIGHIGEVGAVRLAKAIWWMMARLAGWDGITLGDSETPSVTVISPNGAEKMKVGCDYTISWIAEDNVEVDSISISYSIDNGSTYTDIAIELENSGAYMWTIPSVSSIECLVQVVAQDSVGNLGSDESDDLFWIVTSIPGDANDDGIIDVQDIIKVEEIILGAAPTLDSDANAEHGVNVIDITTIEMLITSYY